jgi:hypothetical protein
MTELKRKTNSILIELIRLQSVFAQRTAGLGCMNPMGFQPFQGIEYSAMAKAYNAVDALTFELVERILGAEWIREEKYSPICLFELEYAINTGSFIISVPYYDSYRSRFWPALAHETGHILVATKVKYRRGI